MQARIRSAIGEFNADIKIRALISLFMGLLTSSLTFLVILGLSFFASSSGTSWLLLAAGIFLIFMLISVLALLRGASPGEHTGGLTRLDRGASTGLLLLTGLPISPRHTIAGFSAIVIHGPAMLAESWTMFRSLIPRDSRTCAIAAGLLSQLHRAGSIDINQVESPAAAIVLCRTGLAKINAGPSGSAPFLTLTSRGADIAANTQTS